MRPLDITTVTAPADGMVQRIVVSVGDRVIAGQPLVELDDREARRAVSQLTADAAKAREQVSGLEQATAGSDETLRRLNGALSNVNAELAVAQANVAALPVRQAKNSPERAKVAYDSAVALERSAAAVAAKNAATRQDLEDAQIAVRALADELAVARRAAEATTRLAALQAEQARAQTELTLNQQRRSQAAPDNGLEDARRRLGQAEAAVAAATARLAQSTVRANAAGVVATVSARNGDRIRAGVPLLTLTTIDPMVVDVSVPSAVVDRLHRGDGALVALVEGDSTPFGGRILAIAPLPDRRGAYAVSVEFPNPGGVLLAGRAARVRFVAAPLQ
jgi:multidrug resistance efflux pump